MTATQSPRELLSNYRQTSRHAAAEAHAPGNRSEFPGLALEATGMIYLAGKDLVYRGIAGAPAPVNTDRLEAIITEPDSSVVVADTLTYARLMQFADEKGEGFKTLSRRLSFSRGLAASVKLPILTNALSYRYWLPEGMDERNLGDWAKAFDVTGPSTLTTMRALIDLASEGKRPEPLKYSSTVKSLEGTERRILEQAEWSGLSSDVQLYSMLDGFSSTATALRLLDPGLLPMHVLDGQVCKVKPMNATQSEFSASVSDPFKFKAGKKMRLSDGISLAETTLEALRYTEDALHAVFAQPQRGAGPTMVASAKQHGGRPLYAMEAPFSARGSIIKNKRWLNPKEPVGHVSGRQVPLDVILAGAPTE